MIKLNHLKKLIVLVGLSDAGKSTTLQYLANCTMHTAGYTRGKALYTPWEVTPPGGPFPFTSKPHYDNRYVLTKNKDGRTIIVGVSTFGDTDKCVDKGFEWFENNQCEIGILAAKTRGLSIEEVEKVTSNNGIKPIYVYLISKDTVAVSTRSRTDVETEVADLIVSLI